MGSIIHSIRREWVSSVDETCVTALPGQVVVCNDFVAK